MGNEFAHPDFVDLPSEANGATLSCSDPGKRERERERRLWRVRKAFFLAKWRTAGLKVYYITIFYNT